MKTIKKNKYTVMIFVGFTIWILETWYFGWNDKAESVPEKILDVIVFMLLFWGIMGDLFSSTIIIKIK